MGRLPMLKVGSRLGGKTSKAAAQLARSTRSSSRRAAPEHGGVVSG